MCETVCIMYMVDNNALIARSGARDRVSVVTRTSYLPSTHPTVMLHLKSITAMMDAASKNRDDCHQDDVFNSLAALKTMVQSLRINIAVDPVATTFEELQTLFLEISSKEACAHATLCQYKTALGHAISDDFLVSLEVNYNFVLKSRMHLETEIMRCRPPQNASHFWRIESHQSRTLKINHNRGINALISARLVDLCVQLKFLVCGLVLRRCWGFGFALLLLFFFAMFAFVFAVVHPRNADNGNRQIGSFVASCLVCFSHSVCVRVRV